MGGTGWPPKMFEGTAVRDLDGNGSARYFLTIGDTVLFGGVFLAIGGTATGLTDWEVWALAPRVSARRHASKVTFFIELSSFLGF